ncbi:hypothetical protein RFF05_17840 [Bengtsoniella intestinalis]|uniref:hypothetical protein n=1 Tax=Bengtsoniella intestinalis TaxID=3073143 RepID=UPI00391F5E98
MKISAKVTAPNHRKSVNLVLPVSHSVLEDTLQKLQSDGIVYGGGKLYIMDPRNQTSTRKIIVNVIQYQKR